MNKIIQEISDCIDEGIENGYFFRGITTGANFINDGAIDNPNVCIKSSKDIINHSFCSGVAVMPELSDGLIILDFDTKDNEIKSKITKYIDNNFGANQCIRIGSENKLYQFWCYTESATKFDKAINLEIINKHNERKRVNALGLNKDTGKKLLWPKLKFWEIPFNELPKISDKQINDLISICGIAKKADISTVISESSGDRCNHGSHKKLSEMLVAAINSGDSPETTVKTLLEFDEKINPNISYFLCPERKEWKINNRELNCFKFVMQGFENHIKNGSIKTLSVINKPIVTIGKTKLQDRERVSYPKLRGYGQELFEICYGKSPVPKSRFSSMAVLSLISVLMGNKYTYQGLQPNLYSILITGQGGGKDYPLKFAKTVLLKLGLKELVGMSNPASDVSLIMNLVNQRTRLDTIDEATRLFKGMGSTSSAHMSSMSEMVNELFSAPSSIFGGKTAQKYQDDKKNEKGNIGACYSPFVSLISATTFSGFKATFKEELFDSGLGSRFFYVIDEKTKPPKRKDPRFELSEDLKNFLLKIRGNTKYFIDLEKNGANGQFPIWEMQATQKAELALDAFSNYCYEITVNSDKSSKIKAMHSRSTMHVTKLAMIDAVLSTGNIHPKITVENVEWAIRWVTSNIKSVENHINTMIVSSFFESEMNKVESYIEKKGTRGATKTEISRASKGVDNYGKYLSRLEDSGVVFCVKTDGDAPQTKRYFHESFARKV